METGNQPELLLKTQSAYLNPWRGDLEIGSVKKNKLLYLTISASEDWSGKLIFDRKRHSDFMHLPIDWPRINQFPEYFTVENEKSYSIISFNDPKGQIITGKELMEGYDVKIKKGETLKLIVSTVP